MKRLIRIDMEVEIPAGAGNGPQLVQAIGFAILTRVGHLAKATGCKMHRSKAMDLGEIGVDVSPMGETLVKESDLPIILVPENLTARMREKGAETP